MIKKIAVYGMIIFATALLLAHAVIPHHHHQNQVCIVLEQCSDAAIPHNPDQPGHHDHDDKKGSPNSCLLSEFIPASLNNGYRFCNCTSKGDKHFHDFHFVLYSGFPKVSSPFTGIIIRESVLTLFCSSPEFSLTGPRAPPFV